MFIINWVFDKLGYMPKINAQIGEVELKLGGTWPFPAEEKNDRSANKKQTVKKATTRTAKKPAVVAKTARTKKVK